MKNANRKKIQEQKLKSDRKANRILTGVGIAFFLGIFVFYWFYFRSSFEFGKSLKQYVGKAVPDSIICMVSNTIIPETPEKVIIEGKTYRGCCLSCISKLKYNIDNSRYAIDPYSNHSVDKADAYITTIDVVGNVIYFETKDDFHNYLHRNHFENESN